VRRACSGLVPLLALAVAVVLAVTSPVAGAADPPSAASSKLRGDLAALVSGARAIDSGVPGLVPGYQPGELVFFAVLREPNDAAHRAAIAALGARVLRAYASVDAFALAASPTTVLRVAALPWVEWLAPVEVVVALDHRTEGDQTRATTQDVGAPALWDQGIRGRGVRIAVIDTGLDAAHPDLDDLDFRHWTPVGNPTKIVGSCSFLGGGAAPLGTTDGHGHGTHVAGIVTGTGAGTPLPDDDGRIVGIAPDAELAVAKALTDAGAGLNSDLLAAMEWAAMPPSPPSPERPCGSVGADVVNLSVGSEARPDRLNSGSDRDLVSLTLNRLAVSHGTIVVAAAGNSGPFIGSVLESPGSAAQALSVGAAAKDFDLNNDGTQSGDTCAGWSHDPPTGFPLAQPCAGRGANQPPSIASLSSRGPSGDLWLRPDLAAPGYNVVSAQASTGAALATNDLNLGTRSDPLYATASGTSMAAPVAAGSAALLLDAYERLHGGAPSGASGVTGLPAPAYVLVRAALMNTAGPDLYEARWILTTELGSLILQEVRNRPADPFVGPLAEGAGKLNVGRAVTALRAGVVAYSAASPAEAVPGAGPRDFQGSWQIGAIGAGASQTQRFVLHSAPTAPSVTATFAFDPGHPSDGSSALPASWITLPGNATVPAGGDAMVQLGVSVPAGAQAGTYTGAVVVGLSNGQVLRLPVLASVALHDPDAALGNAPGPQARIASARDVFAKDDTTWPSVLGTPGTGANADWLVFPVELGSELSEARFAVYDVDGRDTYDLYLYDERLDLVASTHPFAAPGVTDGSANDARGASTAASPQVLALRTPAAGRHYLAVSRARIGGTTPGSFGRYVLTLDEVRVLPPAAEPTALSYEGEFVFVQGSAGRLAARLTDAAGAPVAGRLVTFAFDDPPVSPCPGGVCSARTDYRGLAQVATDPIALGAGVHEVRAAFGGDPFWRPSSAAAFVLVVGGELPGAAGGKVTAGGWFVPDGAASASPAERVHFAFHAAGSAAPAGELRYRDAAAGVELALLAYTALVVDGDQATLTGSARRSDGQTESFHVTVRDGGEPGRSDTFRLQLLQSGYERSGTLGGGNIQIHRG